MCAHTGISTRHKLSLQVTLCLFGDLLIYNADSSVLACLLLPLLNLPGTLEAVCSLMPIVVMAESPAM